MNIARIVSGVAVATAAVTLSACGGNPISDAVNGAVENAVENQVENIIENQTGVDVDIDNGTGSASIPDGFPSDIPLPAGNPASASRIEDMYFLGWANPAEDEYYSLVEQFNSAGWTEITSSEMGDSSSKILSWMGHNGELSIMISFIDEGDETQMSYTVGPYNS